MPLWNSCLHWSLFAYVSNFLAKLRLRDKKGHGKGGFGDQSGLCDSVQYEVTEIEIKFGLSVCLVVGGRLWSFNSNVSLFLGSLTQVFKRPRFKAVLQSILSTPAVLVKQLSLTCDSSKLNQSNSEFSRVKVWIIHFVCIIHFIHWLMFVFQPRLSCTRGYHRTAAVGILLWAILTVLCLRESLVSQWTS